MARGETYSMEIGRVRLLLAVMAGLLTMLVAGLWWIQVGQGRHYESSLTRQSIRRIRLPPVRGSIVDRDEACLAGNRPSYCVTLRLEEMRRGARWERTVEDVDRTVDSLAAVVGLPRAVTSNDIRMHIRRRLPIPFVAWRDIGGVALARLAEQAGVSRACEITVEPAREYPQGTLAAHVLGYVGAADFSTPAQEPFDYYLPQPAGRRGIEAVMNDALSGEAGSSLVCIDARGFQFAEIARREPVPGADVMLTIDSRVQRLAEESLGADPGAVVVLDPRNGDVLALASSPAFDPRIFVPSISPAEWDRLAGDPGKPMLNRAASGVYAPGSLFKPLVAIAALQDGAATPATTFSCPGYYLIGGRVPLRCWNPSGHGTIALRKAIEQSCNSYFAQLGLMAGYDAVRATAAAANLGARTGIDLDGESAGLLPDEAWKRRQYRDAWRDGDTCNVCVGQGPINVTPLQMAVVAATLANGGRLYRPRVVRGVRRPGAERFELRPPVLVRETGWPAEAMRAVRQGMRDVVETPGGTGHRAKVPGIELAGKTGTAEYGPKAADKQHGWMMAFGPFESPRVAVAMVVDDAVSGGVTVAPRLQRLLQGILAPGEGGRGG